MTTDAVMTGFVAELSRLKGSGGTSALIHEISEQATPTAMFPCRPAARELVQVNFGNFSHPLRRQATHESCFQGTTDCIRSYLLDAAAPQSASCGTSGLADLLFSSLAAPIRPRGCSEWRGRATWLATFVHAIRQHAKTEPPRPGQRAEMSVELAPGYSSCFFLQGPSSPPS